jgi:hypothetical protein
MKDSQGDGEKGRLEMMSDPQIPPFLPPSLFNLSERAA